MEDTQNNDQLTIKRQLNEFEALPTAAVVHTYSTEKMTLSIIPGIFLYSHCGYVSEAAQVVCCRSLGASYGAASF